MRYLLFSAQENRLVSLGQNLDSKIISDHKNNLIKADSMSRWSKKVCLRVSLVKMEFSRQRINNML